MKVRLQSINTLIAAFAAALMMSTTSCSDNKSYAEYLEDEQKAVNLYLSDHRVIAEIPADTVFEYGEDAPFYQLGEDGDVFMQVIEPGDRENNRVKDDQEIYFRFTRRSLISLANYGTAAEEGNADDMGYGSMSFRYNNYTLESTSQYGYGIQMPLAYLGIDCVVNLIVKSQYGFSEEIANVIPYLYRIRYYKGKI